MKLQEKLAAIQSELALLWSPIISNGHGLGGYTDKARADALDNQRFEIQDSVAGRAYNVAIQNCEKQVLLYVQAIKEVKAAEQKAIALQHECDVLKHTRDILGSVEV